MFLPVFLTITEKARLHSEFEERTLPRLDYLYDFALRITCNKRKAVKLLKETYSKAAWFYPHLDEQIEVNGWMLRIMRNSYLDSFRKDDEPAEVNRSEIDSSYNKIKEVLTDISFLEKVKKEISEKELLKILSSVPYDLRVVIVLNDIKNFNDEETADFIDCPVGIVHSRLERGRKMLFVKMYNQFSDSLKIERLKQSLENKKSDFDLEVQKAVKSIVSEGLKIQSAPERIKKKVMKAIKKKFR